MNFLESNFFIGLATILTGGTAIFIYLRQRKDNKTKAARVLLLEIRAAEERIEQIRDQITNHSTSDLPLVFPTKSWKTYSHLFVDDFDHDEWKLISSFYDYGEVIEDYARKNNDFFWVTTEERARVTTNVVAEFVKEAIKQNSTTPDAYVQQRRDLFSLLMDRNNTPYVPQKTLTQIGTYLTKIRFITTSSCGIKLKKIAGLP